MPDSQDPLEAGTKEGLKMKKLNIIAALRFSLLSVPSQS